MKHSRYTIPLVFILTILLTPISKVWGGDEIYNNRITSSDMQIVGFNGVTGVTDDKIADLGTGAFTVTNVYDRVILGVNHEEKTLETEFHYRFNLKIESFEDQYLPPVVTYSSLVLEYDPTGTTSYLDKSVYQTTGGHAIQVTIESIEDITTISNPVVLTYAQLASNVYIETEIEIERYYLFDPAFIPDIHSHVVGVNNDKIEFYWHDVAGAESYQLEWMHINDYLRTDYANMPVDFVHNSSRVEITANEYKIPLLFEKGYVLYRVRAVGRDLTDTDWVLHGAWSSSLLANNVAAYDDISSGVDDAYHVTVAHEEGKNWQMTTTFAEEGKKKEVISYHDGSLRNRQSVTKINTDEHAVVGETIYDHQGRPAVQILPVPVVTDEITYYDNFNLNNAANPEVFSRSDFDTDNGSCGTVAPTLSTSSGASQYYSDQNPKVGEGHNKYIPDAGGYVYSQVEYTPDNTGRIRRQGGVGAAHQLGSGHESKYYYSQPGQRSLDQLFGSDVGNAVRYRKNFVIDANGQVSVSYTDMTGRVIATALAGQKPNNLLDIPEYTTSEILATDDLFAEDANGVSQQNVIKDGNSIVFLSQYGVTTAGDHTFDYSMDYTVFTDPCLSGTVCYTCVYDLEISIVDECGTVLYSRNEQIGTIDETNCSVAGLIYPTSGPSSFVVNLLVGTYTINKKLVLNAGAMQQYESSYQTAFEQAGSCLGSLTDFTNDYLAANLDTSGCNIDCSTCYSTLGTLEDWYAREAGTAEEYALALQACDDMCDYVNLCDSRYFTLLQDVTPLGQYAKYNILSDGSYNAFNKPLSVLNIYNKLPENIEAATHVAQAYWRKPKFIDRFGNEFNEYRETDGTRTLIEVFPNASGTATIPEVVNPNAPFVINPELGVTYFDGGGWYYTYPENLAHLKDFVDEWHDGWEYSLVAYHPEYCYYTECIRNSLVPSSSTQSSEDFDRELVSTNTWVNAKATFTTNGDLYIFDKDPYFSYSHIVSQTPPPPHNANSYIQLLNNYLTNYSSGNASQSPENYYYIALMIVKGCANMPGATATDIDNCMGMALIDATTIVGIVDALPTDKQDEFWGTLRAMYLSTKQKVQTIEAHRFVHIECNAANTLIGNEDFSWSDINQLDQLGMNDNPPHEVPNELINLSLSWPFWTFEPSYYYGVSNLNYSMYGWYDNKIKRFSDENSLLSLDPNDDLQAFSDEMANLVNYNQYVQTGQCPNARDLEYLLKALGQDGNLNQSTVSLPVYSEFTPNMYYLIVDQNANQFVPFEWNSTVSVDGNALSIDIAPTDVTVNTCLEDIRLIVPNGIGFNFNTLGVDYVITGVRQLQAITTFGSVPGFQVIFDIDNINDPDPPYAITVLGQTCSAIDLAGCEADFASVCEPLEPATILFDLLSSLAVGQSGTSEFASSGINIGTGSGHAPLMQGLQAYLGTSATWIWYSTPATHTFSINGATQTLSVVFASSAINYSDLVSFSNFKVDLSNPGNTFTVEATTFDGTTTSVIPLTGTISFTGVSNPFNIGNCGTPEIIACSSPQHQTLEELLPFLQEIIQQGGLDATSSAIDLSMVSQYTNVINGQVGVSENPLWENIVAGLGNLSVIAEINGEYTYNDGSGPQTLSENGCQLTFEFVNETPLFTFATPSGPTTWLDYTILDIIADETDLTSGYAYTFYILISDGTNQEWVRVNSCMSVANCTNNCGVNVGYVPYWSGKGDENIFGITESTPCSATSSNYLIYTTYVTPSFAIPSEEFCQYQQCYYGYEALIDHCVAASDFVKAAFTDPDSEYYISLAMYCDAINGDCGHTEVEIQNYFLMSVYFKTPAFASLVNDPAEFKLMPLSYLCNSDCIFGVDQYYEYFSNITVGGAFGVDASDPVAHRWDVPYNLPSFPPLVSPAEFCQNSLANWDNDYLNYLTNTTFPDGAVPLSITEFSNGGIPAVPCTPSIPVNQEPTESLPYYNPCAQHLLNVATMNAENEYNFQLTQLTNNFIINYKNKCLQVNEDFSATYVDREYNYTLFYYDQAGNLVRTVPPEGVELLGVDNGVTDQAVLDQINEDRTNNAKTIYTNHTYETTYEFNSLNQLVRQSMPDHDLIDNITAVITNTGIAPNLDITSVQFTGNGNGYLTATDGNEMAYYATSDGGLTWNLLSHLGTDDFKGVHINASGVGYAVGKLGKIAKTVDFGVSWVVLPASTTENLNDVYFNSDVNGIVVGDNGVALYTTDGGNTWTTISGINGNIVDIDFNTLAEGVAVIENGTDGKIYTITSVATGSPYDWSVWTAANDINFSNELKAVQKISTNEAYAVGDEGVLLHTTGSTWDLISMEITDQLVDLHFHKYTPSNGVVLTSVGETYYTSDHGANWILTSPSGVQFDAIQFINPDQGFAISDQGPVAQVYKTEDGGLSWLGLSSVVSTGLNKVFFETVDIGYAFGVGLFKTIDGGQAWTPVNTPGSIDDLYMNGSEGIAVVAGVIYFTNDDGSNWSTPVLPSSIPVDVVSIEAVSPTEIYSVSSTGVINSTSDIGDNWSVVSTPTGITGVNDFSVINNGTSEFTAVNATGEIMSTTGSLPLVISSSDVQPELLTGVSYGSGVAITATGINGKVYRSTNNGLVWNLELTGMTKNMNAIDFFDDEVGVIVGEQGSVYTRDNSGTWTEKTNTIIEDINDVQFQPTTNTVTLVGDLGTIYTHALPTNYFSPIGVCSNANINALHHYGTSLSEAVFVGNGGNIYVYNGSTFTCQTSVTYPSINASQMVTSQIGYSVGNAGTILYTEDGGTSWITIPPHPNLIGVNLNGLFFTNINDGIIIGDGGAAYRTSDGGQNWFDCATINTSENLRDVYFTDNLNGAIVGENGTVFNTTTGLQGWAASTVLPSGTLSGTILNAVYLNGANGWFVGDGGRMFKTIDYGANWSEMLQPPLYTQQWTTVNLNDVYFQDDNYGWIIGDNGTILKTKNGGDTWEVPVISGATGTDNLTSFTFTDEGVATIVGTSTTGNAPVVISFTDDSDKYSTHFWYDALGRIVASQDTRQFKKNADGNTYSYTRYDELGRVIEAGEIHTLTDIRTNYIVGNQIDYTLYEAWLLANAGAKTEVAQSYYDKSGFSVPGINGNDINLRNRIAAVSYDEDGDGVYESAKHYAYDIHGNVKILIEERPELAGINQEFKRIDYTYDLLSGNVHEVAYQKDQVDEFYHRYEYDGDNRLTNVYVSEDGVIWDQDAKYFYYDHGPLARVEKGNLKVQAEDFAYNILGWLKGVNSNTLKSNRDIGNDGLTGGSNENVAQDEFGFTLGYFNTATVNDYTPIGDATTGFEGFEATTTGSNLLVSSGQLYNGNISHMVTSIRQFMNGSLIDGSNPQPNEVVHGTVYNYDQLNRIRNSRSHIDANVATTNTWSSSPTGRTDYAVDVTYDANGNIETLERKGAGGTDMDNMVYHYERLSEGHFKNRNRLLSVDENATQNTTEDIQPGQIANNYAYDAIGQLIQDVSEGIENIEWTAAHKVRKIIRFSTSDKDDVEFLYDAMGNRTGKISKPKIEIGTSGTYEIIPQDEWSYTYYNCDAQGNQMAIYKKNYLAQGGNNYTENYILAENNIYGSSRVGSYQRGKSITEKAFTADISSTGEFINVVDGQLTIITDDAYVYDHVLGEKVFQQSNHLGNVLVTVSDLRTPLDEDATVGIIDGYKAVVQSYSDYYPGGSLQPGRNGNANSYGFGYQGSRKDDEISGSGNSYTTYFRQLDVRLVRWWSVDPEAASQPWSSPYVTMGNNPISRIDPFGNTDDNYGVTSSGEVRLLEENDQKDRLYSIDGNGKILDKENYVEFSKDDVLDNYKITNREYMTAGGTATGKFSSIGYLKTENKDDAFKLFKFTADNSNVEWSITGYESNNEKSYVTHTGFSETSTPQSYLFSDVNVKEMDMFFKIHSHPVKTGVMNSSSNEKLNGASGYGDNSPFNTDRDNYFNTKYKFQAAGKKVPKHYVYQIPNKTLYNYDISIGDRLIRKISNYKSFYFGNF